MLCHKCEGIDFQFVDELPQSQQQKLQRVWIGRVSDLRHESHSESYYYYMLHDTFDELALSVDQGCHLCNVIYMALTRKMKAVNVPAAARQHLPVVLRSWSSKQRMPFTDSILARALTLRESDVNKYHYHHHLTLGDITVTYNGFSIELGLRKGLNEAFALPSHGLGLMLSQIGSCEADSTTGSQTSLELLKQWLDDCRENHPQCRGPKTPLPTRVIDVGSPEDGHQPRVLDTTPGQDGDYIALSHCWGNPELRAEIQSWASDPYHLLPLQEWPQTFQQAAQIARALAIPYLWIDTACIKQNDETDFAREASKMADYYIGATLVVAAVHAQDSRKGCFVERNPLLVRPCPIRFKGCGENNFFVNLKPEDTSDRTETEPLRSRAWCFQETLLSRRTAAFCRDQLRWSCLRRKASEDDPDGWQVANMHAQSRPLVFLRTFLHHPPGALSAKLLENNNEELVEWQKKIESQYLLYKPHYPSSMKEEERMQRNPAYQKWYDCVEYFTNRKITYARDTLPAMSGLARKMHNTLSPNDIYYGGLWSGDIVRGLLWMVLTPVLRKQPEYIAPSWSWASRTGQRVSSFFDETIMCDPYVKGPTPPSWRELLEALEPRHVHVEMELKYPDAVYGEVISGRLHCSVRLLHGGKVGKVRRSPFGKSIYSSPHPAYHRGLGGFQKDDRITNWNLAIPAAWAVEPSKTENSTVPTELEGEISPDDYSAVHWLSTNRPFHLEGQEVSVMLLWPFKFQGDRCIGLGLVKIDAGKNEYKRVGRVEFLMPYEKLWAWTQSNAEHEEIVIV